MRHKITNLVLSLIFLLQPLAVLAKRSKKNPINQELSSLITSKLDVTPHEWNYRKVPYINFEIGKDGKAKNIKTIKYKNVRPNNNNCIAAIFDLEPFPEKFRNQTYGYECKPKKVFSRKQIKRNRRYFSKYMKEVQLKVKENWHPVKSNGDYAATASFLINDDGSISELKLIKKTEDAEADKIALRAVELSAPFEKLDRSKMLEPQKQIEVQFNFDYNRHTRRQMSPAAKAGTAAVGIGAIGALGAAAIWGRPRRNRYRYRYGRYGYGRRNRPWWW